MVLHSRGCGRVARRRIQLTDLLVEPHRGSRKVLFCFRTRVFSSIRWRETDAARRVVPRLGCLEAGEWWWFENSRAYLYYFFIVNDCQFIVRSSASGREALKDGEVFVRCAFPYKAIVNFLVFESHMLAFCKVFLWRVRFWLRMNAGGVLNTCKSNGIHQACLVVRVANG